MNSLKWTLISLVEHITLRIDNINISDSDNEIRQLFSVTAQVTCDACSNLSSGLLKSADEDDNNGWLPFALAIRMFPIEDNYGKPSIAAMRFKAAALECALKKCLVKCTDGWGWQVEEQFKHYSKSLEDRNLSDRWRMMVIAEVGLHRVHSVGNQIISDGPRLLACVQIAGMCAELGMALFFDVDTSDDCTGGIYKNIAEADVMSQSLESLENLCTQIKKNIKVVYVFPHLRRAKEVLTLLAVYFRHQKVEASQMAQHRGEISLEQKTLSGLGWLNNDSQTQGEASGDS